MLPSTHMRLLLGRHETIEARPDGSPATRRFAGMRLEVPNLSKVDKNAEDGIEDGAARVVGVAARGLRPTAGQHSHAFPEKKSPFSRFG